MAKNILKMTKRNLQNLHKKDTKGWSKLGITREIQKHGQKRKNRIRNVFKEIDNKCKYEL